MKHIMFAVACVALVAAPALGDWSDDFQSYAVGSQIIPQGGWAGWNGASFTTALVAADPASVAGNNALKEVTSNNLVNTFTGATSGSWVFKAKMYIPATAHVNSSATSTASINLMNKYVSGAAAAKGYGAQLNFNLGTAASTSDTVTDTRDGGTLLVVFGSWVEVRVEVNLETNLRATYYNGKLLGFGQWYDPADANQAKEVAAIDLPMGSTATTLIVYYDDMSLLPGTSTSTSCPNPANEDFQSYALNSTITGQCRWSGWDGTVFNAIVTDDPAGTAGNQVLKESANNDMVQVYTGYTSGAWVYSAKQYIPSSQQGKGNTNFILMNKYGAGANTPRGWGTQLRFDLTKNVVWDEEASTGNVPVVYDAWSLIEVKIDLDANLRSTYYNGTLVGTAPWYSTLSTSHAKSIAAVDLWADAAGDPIYYDDLFITPGTAVVPPVDPALDITTAGKVKSRYLVGLGQLFAATVEWGIGSPSGLIDFASGGGNQQPWWRLNDGDTNRASVMVTFAGSSPDYFGYKFKLPATVTNIVWWNSVFFDGGTFAATPEVQYLDAVDGTWHTIADVTWDKPYDNVYNYGTECTSTNTFTNGSRRYVITINNPPTDVWGMRLWGDPKPGAGDAGGTCGQPGTGFIGVTEMTLYGTVNVGALDLSTNLARTGGTAIARRCQQGATGIARLNDGVVNVTADSFGGVSPTGEDWVGVTWATPQSNVAAVGVVFAHFKDGGYLGSDLCGPNANIRIETTTDGTTWTAVTGLDQGRYPASARKLQSLQETENVTTSYGRSAESAWLFRFTPVSGITGIRVVGKPLSFVLTDGDGFIGWQEFEVFANSSGGLHAATDTGASSATQSPAGKLSETSQAEKQS